MTFKDLRKIIAISSQQQQGLQQRQTTLFSSRVWNKPFWIWNVEEHKVADIITNGDCCFNHIIGLPKKNAQDKPFFDYEKILFDTLQQRKHIWIKKATGLEYLNDSERLTKNLSYPHVEVAIFTVRSGSSCILMSNPDSSIVNRINRCSSYIAPVKR
jgi:hypothetical protein